jgi:hypothetical protein
VGERRGWRAGLARGGECSVETPAGQEKTSKLTPVIARICRSRVGTAGFAVGYMEGVEAGVRMHEHPTGEATCDRVLSRVKTPTVEDCMVG